METTLKGTDGSEEVTVDSVGRVQSINEESRVEPVQGNDVYLTIDSDLQEACYQILEQRIAGILVSNIQPIKSLEAAGIDPSETDAIPIPIYDVYYALIENSVINLDHFTEAGASAMEQWVYQAFVQKQEEVQSAVSAQLSADTSVPYSQLSSEMQEYVDYIVDDMLTEAGILNSETIDTSDSYISSGILSIPSPCRRSCPMRPARTGWMSPGFLRKIPIWIPRKCTRP